MSSPLTSPLTAISNEQVRIAETVVTGYIMWPGEKQTVISYENCREP